LSYVLDFLVGTCVFLKSLIIDVEDSFELDMLGHKRFDGVKTKSFLDFVDTEGRNKVVHSVDLINKKDVKVWVVVVCFADFF